MSLTDMVIMPGADYQDACDAIREMKGTTATILSGDMGALIRSISSSSGSDSGSSSEETSVIIYDTFGKSSAGLTLDVSTTIIPSLPNCVIWHSASSSTTASSIKPFTCLFMAEGLIVSCSVVYYSTTLKILDTTDAGEYVAYNSDGGTFVSSGTNYCVFPAGDYHFVAWE